MKFIKENLQSILIALLVGLFIWQFFFSKDDTVKEPTPVQVVIPSVEGSSGLKVIENVKAVPVYIPSQGTVTVDEQYKQAYENAKDSIDKLNLFLLAIQVKEKTETVIDNDTLKLDAYFKTRGDILAYKFDYKIKDRVFSYEPQVIKERPRFSISVEADAGIPTTPTSTFLMRGGLGFENKRGEAVTVGYDTENRLWLGLRKNFKIIK